MKKLSVLTLSIIFTLNACQEYNDEITQQHEFTKIHIQQYLNHHEVNSITQVDPAKIAIQHILGIAAYLRHTDEESDKNYALTLLKRFIEDVPDSSDTSVNEAYYQLGNINQKLNQKDKSIFYLEKSITISEVTETQLLMMLKSSNLLLRLYNQKGENQKIILLTNQVQSYFQTADNIQSRLAFHLAKFYYDRFKLGNLLKESDETKNDFLYHAMGLARLSGNPELLLKIHVETSRDLSQEDILKSESFRMSDKAFIDRLISLARRRIHPIENLEHALEAAQRKHYHLKEIKVLMELAYHHSVPYKKISYLKKALELAKTQNHQPLVCQILIKLSELEKSRTKAYDAYDIAKKLNDYKFQIQALLCLANNDKLKLDKQLEYARKARTIARKSNKTDLIERSYFVVSNIHTLRGDHQRAINTLEDLLKTSSGVANESQDIELKQKISKRIIEIKRKQRADTIQRSEKRSYDLKGNKDAARRDRHDELARRDQDTARHDQHRNRNRRDRD